MRCRNEHLTLLTASFLQELARDAGFKVGAVMLPKVQTGRPDTFAPCLLTENDEDPAAPNTLIIEFEK